MKTILLIIAILAIFISTNPTQYSASHMRNIYVATIYTTQFGDTLVGVLNNIVSVDEVRDFLFDYPRF